MERKLPLWHKCHSNEHPSSPPKIFGSVAPENFEVKSNNEKGIGGSNNDSNLSPNSPP